MTGTSKQGHRVVFSREERILEGGFTRYIIGTYPSEGHSVELISVFLLVSSASRGGTQMFHQALISSRGKVLDPGSKLGH